MSKPSLTISGTQRAGCGQRLEDPGRAQVAEEIEMLAQRQQGRPLRLLRRRQALPLGAADRAEENGVALFTEGKGCRRQGLAVIVDGDAADIGVAVKESSTANFFWTASRTLIASAITSGPIPSPARTAIFFMRITFY